MEKEKFELEQRNLREDIIVSPLENDKLISIAEAAERRAEAIKKIKRQALRITNERDWTDQNGRPYIQASGAEKIARLFGISWRFIGEPQRFDEDDGHFRFDVSMEFVMGGSTVEVRGSRSSKDPFFTTRYKYDDEKKGKIKFELPPTEIDKADVMKSAITNAIGNGISRILGIRNLTWDDLKEAGLNPERIAKIEYSKPKSPEKPSSETSKNEASLDSKIKDPSQSVTEGQLYAINKMLDRLNITDEFERCEKVSSLLKMDSVIPSLNDLKKSEASKIIEALQKEGTK
jgi:hypothetical protein